MQKLNIMKAAAQISELGMKKAFEANNPGVRQCDAVVGNLNHII